MAKFSLAVLATLVASATAFVAPKAASAKSALQASKSEIWDPLGLYELGSGEAFDTFPNCFPDKQFLEAAEIKHGRQAMLAWTGVWATTEVGLWELQAAPSNFFYHNIRLCSHLTFNFIRAASDLACTSLDSRRTRTGRLLLELSLRNSLFGSVPSWDSLPLLRVRVLDTLETTSEESPPRMIKETSTLTTLV